MKSFLISLLACSIFATDAVAQHRTSSFEATALMQVSTGRLVTGAVAGGAAGLLLGGAIGLMIGGNRCVDPGNPDSCSGLEGMVVGASLGMSAGIPVGTHLANHRRGRLLPSLAVSVAMPLVVAGIAELADEDRVYAVLLAVPIAQVVTSVMIEGRSN
jgi:hypothetical protein